MFIFGMIIADIIRDTIHIVKELRMKKTVFLLLTAFVAASGLFAAGSVDQVAVEGKLAITDSIPQIVTNGKAYLFPEGPFYQLAWENNVKIGDTIKAEGVARDCPPDFAVKNALMLMPSKVWVNGKEINLSTVRRHFGMKGKAEGPHGERGKCVPGDAPDNGDGSK